MRYLQNPVLGGGYALLNKIESVGENNDPVTIATPLEKVIDKAQTYGVYSIRQVRLTLASTHYRDIVILTTKKEDAGKLKVLQELKGLQCCW